MTKKKVIYISGPLGVPNYWEAFEKAEEELLGFGFIPISPSRLPAELSEAQYARIALASIDAADAVYFLPGWDDRMRLERDYCLYTDKRFFTSITILKGVLK